jgi:hypothetical protein
MASGCCAGPPSHIGWALGSPVRKPDAIAGFIHQSGTTNWASALKLYVFGKEADHCSGGRIDTEINPDKHLSNTLFYPCLTHEQWKGYFLRKAFSFDENADGNVVYELSIPLNF